MPAITIDGRGLTPTEAVADLQRRAEPLRLKGYHPITEVEIVDTKTKKVVEHYPFPEGERVAQSPPAPRLVKTKEKEHKPPTAHEYPYLARLTLEY
ncbi:MAG: hypothetical protein OK456_01595 [Thaumarchaeota archaeon]|nr:hypothetical protein [Nitrososphaerota archaeon]